MACESNVYWQVTTLTMRRGYYTAARLAQHNAHVYLCARSESKGRTTTDSITKLYSNAKISILVMDHTSLSSVVAAAKEFLSKESALHGLVNNAGIMATAFATTKDGHEEQWQTNYLAHWVLTKHLLPIMLETSKTMGAGSVRIVELTSGGHMMAPKPGIDFSDTSLNKGSPINRYGQSKLGNVLHIKSLHHMYGPASPSAKTGKGEIWTTVIHPGVVWTGLTSKATEMPLYMKVAIVVLNAFGGICGSDEGAWTSVFSVSSPEMKPQQSGTYMTRIVKPGYESGKAKDLKLALKLEEWTQKEMEKEGWVGR